MLVLMGADMRRREFISLLGGAAAAWPLAARAQQPMPVIGFLSSLAPSDQGLIMPAVRRGLGDAGFIEGRNVSIEYRWAEGRYEQLPELAADLTRRHVAVIAAISGTPSALAAKAATTTIPIVFAMASDPVDAGLVGSLNRPGGNITGATFFTGLLGEKRVGLLRELVPMATTIALLVDPDNRTGMVDGTNAQAAAHAIGLRTRIFEVRAGREIDAVFATLANERPDALYVNPDALFFNERNRLVALSARYAIPAIYADRESAEAGGLLSYGASRTDAYRQAGSYVGRILKGEKPGELPVVLPSKYQLLINLKTARALGLTIPDKLLALADEVVE
jgi:putative tryptophan/tyrosine transport system substrate-binding protein